MLIVQNIVLNRLFVSYIWNANNELDNYLRSKTTSIAFKVHYKQDQSFKKENHKVLFYYNGNNKKTY